MKKISIHNASIEIIARTVEKTLGEHSTYAVDLEEFVYNRRPCFTVSVPPDVSGEDHEALYRALGRKFDFPFRWFICDSLRPMVMEP